MLPSAPSFLSNLFAVIVATGMFGARAFLTRVQGHTCYSLDGCAVGAKAQIEGSGSWT